MLRHRTVTAYLKSKQVLALQWLMQIAADTRIAPEMYNAITYPFLTAHNLLTKPWLYMVRLTLWTVCECKCNQSIYSSNCSFET